MAFVGFFVLCGVGALIAAVVIGRFLWRDEQRLSAVVVGSLTASIGVLGLGSAWIWWDGPLF